MNKFYGTFGNHHMLADGTSLADRYCEIDAHSMIEAAAMMELKRGKDWASVYRTKESAGVNRWNLLPVDWKTLTHEPVRQSAKPVPTPINYVEVITKNLSSWDDKAVVRLYNLLPHLKTALHEP